MQRDYEENLIKGRVFVEGYLAAEERSQVRLVFVRPGGEETFQCWGEVIGVNREGAVHGTGVKLAQLTHAERRELHRFASSAPRLSEHPASMNSDVAPGLLAIERETVARSGSLSARVALERRFGGLVWEGLLQNPEITAPEVARIAQNTTLPKPLLDAIVSNRAWLAKPEVRHALLANSAVDGPVLERVVQALPLGECEQVARSRAFRQKVRLAAKRRLK